MKLKRRIAYQTQISYIFRSFLLRNCRKSRKRARLSYGNLLSAQKRVSTRIVNEIYQTDIERLNRTYKASYRPTNGFDNYDGANYDLALRVAYYNFLRPHKHNNYKALNNIEMLENADNMPTKWQLLLYLGH